MTTATLSEVLSVGECADEIGAQAWRIARLFETGALPEVSRIGNRRIIPRALIPQIVKALTERGWLTSQRVSRPEGAE